MEEFGDFLGWASFAFYIVSLANYFIKLTGRLLIPHLGNLPTVKNFYIKIVMRIFVRDHKYFGIAAGILALVHFIVRYISGMTSVIGLISTIMMLLTMILGITILAAGRNNPKIKNIHRACCACVLIVMIIHIATAG